MDARKYELNRTTTDKIINDRIPKIVDLIPVSAPKKAPKRKCVNSVV
jgi:hypothetical protein